ncbi:N-6 DNA methylase [Halobacteria archaeon AArc-curdl1]|uniref:N-6 DNA methylase n=1 Tax=Natronosalvus hydrolyticus TaxID=2979988 RepID=A0AAP3E777_9EURY|nr:N-6 DNA methylase [Halobacteria archaeon AArc-curdl1]
MGSSGEKDESPITPMGLEARRREQIGEVIEQLAGDDHDSPSPFSEPELYRTAASLGIPIWEAEVKERFTARILDRLNYEQDPVAQAFVPVVGETLIEAIKTAAETVVPALNSELPQSLRKRLEDWCELHGFDSLEHTAVQTIIARQALLSVLLQAALYERQRKQHAWPQLDTDPQTALHQIEERTGSPGFEACVLDDVVQLFESTDLQAVLGERHRVLYSSQPTEAIGRLYEALLPSEYRRTIGQHRTPPEIGNLMQTWATSGGDAVLDPGMGAGGLSTPFHPRWDVSTDPGDVTGIDRSPIAARMGITAQTLARQSTTAQLTDFLDLTPEDLDHDVDAVVCNPPYTRYQALPAEYRAERNAQAEDRTGLEIPGTSPLYAYFLYHLRQFLNPGDRAAVIVPHVFLARDYGTPLKQFLLREFHVKGLLMSDPNTESVFENAQTTELILFLEARSGSEETGVTRFIRVDEKQDVPSLVDAVRNGGQGETDWGVIHCFKQADLAPEQKWDRLFDPIDVETSPRLTPLSEVADVRRGLQTGENDFFCLTQETVDAWGIEPRFLERMVPKPEYVEGYDVRSDDWEHYRADNRPNWLLYHTDPIEGVPATTYDHEADRAEWSEAATTEEPVYSVVEYLRHGLPEHKTLSTRATVHRREPWYCVERGDVAPILIAPMSRSGIRFLLNETNARHLNSYYGVYLDPAIGRTGKKALLAYLNSTFVNKIVSQEQHTLSGGLKKIEPGDAKDLPIIDPRELPDTVVFTLADSFDDLREAARYNEDEDPIISRIDSVLEREL